MNVDEYIGEWKKVYRRKGTHFADSNVEPGFQSTNLLDDETNQIAGPALICDDAPEEENTEDEHFNVGPAIGAAALFGAGMLFKTLIDGIKKHRHTKKSKKNIENRKNISISKSQDLSTEASSKSTATTPACSNSTHHLTDKAQCKENNSVLVLSPDQHEAIRKIRDEANEILDNSIIDPNSEHLISNESIKPLDDELQNASIEATDAFDLDVNLLQADRPKEYEVPPHQQNQDERTMRYKQ